MHAQAVASEAVGSVGLKIKGASDTVLSLPLAHPAEFTGVVVAASDAGTGRFAITVGVPTDWTVDQFKGLHYVRFTSGLRNGMYYTIAANTGSQIKLETAGDDLSDVGAGDTFKIVRHWTLGTLFPASVAGTSVNPLTVSADLTTAQRRSEVLLPDVAASGINLPASRHFFFTATGWVAGTTGNPAADDTVLPPDCYFIVRQPAALPDVNWTFLGQIVGSNVVIPLATSASAKQDNPVGLMRPLPVRLADAGLESGFVDSLGKAGFQKRDSLLVFDNSVAGYEKSAVKSYVRIGGIWYSEARGQAVADNEILAPGAGVVVRKYRSAGGATTRWTNIPAY